MVKCGPAMQETQNRSLGWEDTLVKEMATHSSTFTWKIPWMEEPDSATVHVFTKSQTHLSDFSFFLFILLLCTFLLNVHELFIEYHPVA